MERSLQEGILGVVQHNTYEEIKENNWRDEIIEFSLHCNGCIKLVFLNHDGPLEANCP